MLVREGGGGRMIDIECASHVKCSEGGVLKRMTRQTPFNYLHYCGQVCECLETQREKNVREQMKARKERQANSRWGFRRGGRGKGKTAKEEIGKEGMGKVSMASKGSVSAEAEAKSGDSLKTQVGRRGEQLE